MKLIENRGEIYRKSIYELIVQIDDNRYWLIQVVEDDNSREFECYDYDINSKLKKSNIKLSKSEFEIYKSEVEIDKFIDDNINQL
tara:strand:+ start:430 stop:684 length:255 start_codon:yes stop_codon:yes gene_type:complete